MKTATVLAVLVAPVLGSGHALAQGDPDMQGPAIQAPARSGWTASLNLGPAEFHIIPDDGDAQRTEGAGISLRFGKYLSPRTAALLFVDTVHQDARSDLYGGALQLHFDPRWYARLGGGLGRVVLAGDGAEGGDDTYYGAGALLAIGREFLQLRDLAITGEAEVIGNRILEDDADTTVVNIAVHVGVVWF